MREAFSKPVLLVRVYRFIRVDLDSVTPSVIDQA